MKRFLSIFLCMILVFSLAGCGNTEEPIVDDNGDVIHYKEEEIAEGYYILKDDGYYYKFLNTEMNTTGNGNVFLWFTEPYDAAIPRFTTKDKLLYYSETSRPGSVTFYKMTDYGYTLGAMFSVTQNTEDIKHSQIISFAGVYNPYSPVQSAVEGVVTSNATTYLTGINNHEFTSTLLVDDAFLKGLTKDTMYQIEMYCGTVRKTVNIKADTHLFLQESTYTTSAYEELKSKCFEISLPSNLSPGYYYAEGIGLFYYEGKIQDIDEDDIDNLMPSDSESSESTQSENDNTSEKTDESDTTDDIDNVDDVIGDYDDVDDTNDIDNSTQE